MYNRYTCALTDIDECDESLDLNDCDIAARCTNIDGGYNCECDLGYELQPNGRQCQGQFNNDILIVEGIIA